ncbi:MAG: hypothetical protein MI725_00025 [Pirellulales bacterium]|nr:hypothetical protein [Pirellulales bacterium]
MAENVSETLELKASQLEYLDKMMSKYDLPDRSKALRCLITFAIQEAEHEASIFTKIRCANC